jgi:hypothetical protein
LSSHMAQTLVTSLHLIWSDPAKDWNNSRNGSKLHIAIKSAIYSASQVDKAISVCKYGGPYNWCPTNHNDKSGSVTLPWGNRLHLNAHMESKMLAPSGMSLIGIISHGCFSSNCCIYFSIASIYPRASSPFIA